MKQLRTVIFLSMICLFFASCSKDEKIGEDDDKNAPSTQTLASFKADYPNATNVVWSKNNGYEVASFDLSNNSRSAKPKQTKDWYSSNTNKCTYSYLELSWVQHEEIGRATV